MHMRSSQVRGTPARVAVLAALMLGAAALLWPTPAWAHTRLQSSEPAADETVTEPFDTVLLVFSQAVSSDFAEVAVIDPSGNRIDDEAPIMDGARVEQLRDAGPVSLLEQLYRCPIPKLNRRISITRVYPVAKSREISRRVELYTRRRRPFRCWSLGVARPADPRKAVRRQKYESRYTSEDREHPSDILWRVFPVVLRQLSGCLDLLLRPRRD
jgi:methionine-rich copper-binding protein CopC